eukprot:6106785-Pleurochrysis_carterae.AAC.2
MAVFATFIDGPPMLRESTLALVGGWTRRERCCHRTSFYNQGGRRSIIDARTPATSLRSGSSSLPLRLGLPCVLAAAACESFSKTFLSFCAGAAQRWPARGIRARARALAGAVSHGRCCGAAVA